MMRYPSVFLKLHIFFFLALAVLALLSVSAYHAQQEQHYRLLTHRSIELSQILSRLKFHTCTHQNVELAAAGFEPRAALSAQAARLHLPPPLQRKLTFNQLHVEIYEERGEIIYALMRDHCTMFYRDTVERNTYYVVWGGFSLLLVGLVSIYLLLWRNLREMARISAALYDAIDQQERLKTSRELFLRNLMHELKTPITKGKLIVELETPSPNITLLGKLFVRMEHLLQQMAQIEKMHAFSLTTSSQPLEAMIDTAIENLMIDPDKITLLSCEKEITVDQELFTSALQNLIDNAYRHASSYPITIACKEEEICILNSGEPLRRPVEEAFQAFVTERGDGGLGLGLYIAQSVCDMHHFTLTYRYEAGIHCFCIVLGKR